MTRFLLNLILDTLFGKQEKIERRTVSCHCWSPETGTRVKHQPTCPMYPRPIRRSPMQGETKR